MKKKRPPRELPIERLVYTEVLCGVLGEHEVTANNKSNPDNPSYDPDHPKPIRGKPGAPSRWWLPDAYRYIEILKQRSDEREGARNAGVVARKPGMRPLRNSSKPALHQPDNHLPRPRRAGGIEVRGTPS